MKNYLFKKTFNLLKVFAILLAMSSMLFEANSQTQTYYYLGPTSPSNIGFTSYPNNVPRNLATVNGGNPISIAFPGF
jgi:hypothetical protein